MPPDIINVIWISHIAKLVLFLLLIYIENIRIDGWYTHIIIPLKSFRYYCFAYCGKPCELA